MPTPPARLYRLDGPALQDLVETLQAAFGLQLDPQPDTTLTWLDSFDWRLWRRGWTLEDAAEPGGGHRLTLRALDDGRVVAWQHVEAAPDFARRLPDGRLRALLAKVLEPRRLLSLQAFAAGGYAGGLRNADRKLVARLQLLHLDPTGEPAGECGALSLLRVAPVLGYEDDSRALRRHLKHAPGITRLTERALLAQVAACAGRAPGDYSSRFHVPLDPRQDTDSALRRILLDLLESLRRNIDGTLADLDPEFLHDLRVATRRSRSLLTGVRKVFPDEALQPFLTDLKWLFAATGPCRDLDVYLLALDDYAARLPAGLRPHLAPFADWLRAEKARAHAALAEVLTSGRLDAFLTAWQAWLSERDDAALTPRGHRPVGEVAARAILKRYRRLVDDGHRLDAHSPPEAYHRLRKDGKKLRYLMEFFAALFPRKPWKRLLRTHKRLQEVLGDFQDLQIQADRLLAAGRALGHPADGRCPPDTLLALGMLAADLQQRQRHALDAFDATFRELASDAVADELQRLCRQVKRAARA